MTELTRRTVLRLTAGIVGACALDPIWQLGLATANAAPPPEQPGPALEVAAHIPSRFLRFRGSGRYRDGMGDRPPTRPDGPVTTVIALHGRGSSASGVMDMGVEAGLAQMVKAGYPPFAVVAVDGGDSWWHRRVTGEDSGAMVLTELLPMLATKGLDMSRVGFIGWSMGGYGALLLGGMLGPARTAAICAVAPALLRITGRRSRPAHSTGLQIGSRTRSVERPRFQRSRCGSIAAPATATSRLSSSSSHPCAGHRRGCRSRAATRWRRGARIARELAWLAR